MEDLEDLLRLLLVVIGDIFKMSTGDFNILRVKVQLKRFGTEESICKYITKLNT